MRLLLRRAEWSDCLRLRRLYLTAFPAEERAPFWMLRHRRSRETVDFWSIYADGTWAGELYIVHDGKLSYIFYFAVDDRQRGHGIGSLTLLALRRMYPDHRICLAIEQLDPDAPNYAERVRRKRFYERCGYVDLHSKVQEGSVVYLLLGTGGAVQAKEYAHLMQRYMGEAAMRHVTVGMVE